MDELGVDLTFDVDWALGEIFNDDGNADVGGVGPQNEVPIQEEDWGLHNFFQADMEVDPADFAGQNLAVPPHNEVLEVPAGNDAWNLDIFFDHEHPAAPNHLHIPPGPGVELPQPGIDVDPANFAGQILAVPPQNEILEVPAAEEDWNLDILFGHPHPALPNLDIQGQPGAAGNEMPADEEWNLGELFAGNEFPSPNIGVQGVAPAGGLIPLDPLIFIPWITDVLHHLGAAANQGDQGPPLPVVDPVEFLEWINSDHPELAAMVGQGAGMNVPGGYNFLDPEVIQSWIHEYNAEQQPAAHAAPSPVVEATVPADEQGAGGGGAALGAGGGVALLMNEEEGGDEALAAVAAQAAANVGTDVETYVQNFIQDLLPPEA